ncbi:MAG: cobyric acid synthase [Acidimicrobiales bacterium]
MLVTGTSSDSGKSFIVAGLCRLLARRGVRVAPFKAQNMALNAVATLDGSEIGHAQWLQALAAGVEAEAAMNPILLKPTSERASQVMVSGVPVGVWSAAEYQREKARLFPLVLDALSDLRRRFEVVICEGAGSPAEINLLDSDIVNLGLAAAADLPALVVGDIDRGGVFAALFGTVALLPDDLRARVRGFLLNKFRGDPSLLGTACAELERRCGVPTLGVVPMVAGPDVDAEDSLALRGWATSPPSAVLDVAVVRLPHIANFGDLDPLRLEPGVSVRWVGRAGDQGTPARVGLPGSKSTCEDLQWFRRSGLAAVVDACGAPVVAICAGLQMAGVSIDDPGGVEARPGQVAGLGWLPVTTRFEATKVLDRPAATAVADPGLGEVLDGYRIHHGRVKGLPGSQEWLMGEDGIPIGWRRGRFLGTTLHGLFEADGLRTAILRWAAGLRGRPDPITTGNGGFRSARLARLDRIADTLESSIDLDRLFSLIELGSLV